MRDRLLHEGIIVINGDQKHNGNIDKLKITKKIDFAWIEVTNKCNLKCIHCYNDNFKQISKDNEFSRLCKCD